MATPNISPKSKKVLPTVGRSQAAKQSQVMQANYDMEVEEENMPDVVQVETLYVKDDEQVYTSKGKLLTNKSYDPKCSDLNIELERHTNDPKTGIPTLKNFHEKIRLPFRTDDNPFTRHHGFTARDVTRFVWHMPGKDKAFRCLTITKKQIEAERKAKREARAGTFVIPVMPQDEYADVGVIDDGSEGHNPSYSVAGVGQGASPVMAGQ